MIAYLCVYVHACGFDTVQAFDQQRLKMDKECTDSCKTAQELRRVYLNYTKSTSMNRKKLEAALAKDPPKLTDQEKSVCQF